MDGITKSYEKKRMRAKRGKKGKEENEKNGKEGKMGERGKGEKGGKTGLSESGAAESRGTQRRRPPAGRGFRVEIRVEKRNVSQF